DPGAGLERLLVGAEVARDVGASELVVEPGATDRGLEHDAERRYDAIGLAVDDTLPRLQKARDPQVRDGKTRQAGLGLGAATRRPLVADLTAGARRGARVRRDRGRVVVGLDLH